MTRETALVDRRMLECERALVFGMAGETKLVAIRQLQTVSRTATMGIMTIHAAHLPLANRMVVGKIGFGILLLVAAQAVLAHLPPGFDHSRDGGAFALKRASPLAVAFAMNGMALDALDVLGLVWAGKPVPHMI